MKTAIRPLAVCCALLLCSSSRAIELWPYTVTRGDTLIGIARQHLTGPSHWREIQRLNQVRDPRRLVPGSILQLPLPLTRVSALSAKLIALGGSVEIESGGQRRAANVGDTLNAGDIVITGADGSARIEFPDQSKAAVSAQSRVAIELVVRLGNSNAVESRLRLEQGRIESEVAPIGTAKRYLIRTPTVQLGVRGTEFRAGADTPAASRVEVLKGLVGAANTAGAVDVAGGFGSRIEAGKAPSPPRSLLPPPDLTALLATLDRLPIRLAWTALAGAHSYRVLVAPEPSFATVIAEQTVDKPEIALTQDLADGTYHLRIRAADDLGLEGRDATAQITLDARPVPPFLQQPAQNSTARGERATFAWTASEQAARYRIQVAASADFRAPLIDASDLSETKFESNAAMAPGKYFWRVAAIDQRGEQGPLSDAIQFTLKPIPPAPIATDAVPKLDNRSMTFQWQAGEPGQKYEFQLARNREFAPLLVQRLLSEPKIELPRPVGGRFYLRSRTIDSDGYEAPFGPVQILDIPAPELNITAQLLERNLMLSWPAVLQPGWQYELQIARDAGFEQLVLQHQLEQSHLELPRPEAGYYYARVRILPSDGEPGPYAGVSRYEIPTAWPWCCSP